MKTTFGKTLFASGLIAAFGLTAAAAPAFADHGKRQDKRSYGYHDDYNPRAYGKRGRDDRRKHGASSKRKKAAVKTVVVKKTVVVEKPVVIKKTVVTKKVVHAPAPSRKVVKVGHRRHGHYGGYYPGPDTVRWYPAPTRVIVVPERRRYRNVWVVRDYGHRYRGYGHHQYDRDAYQWLAFTAISVALINNMTEYQQRAYEDAQIRATTAPVGETIRWNNGPASGTVTATREGTSSRNRYCREFQKTVTIGNRTEQAYGTACMQPDGAWEVISTTDRY